MDTVFDFLLASWLSDLTMLTNPLLYPFILPTVIYVAFMIIKWTLYFIPIWVLITIIVSVIRSK